jgi:pyrroline-5-carboxylate reductase
MYQLGLIGCGNMGEAMLAGALAAGQVTGDQVILHTRRAERMAELQGKYTGVRTAASNAEVAAAAKLVVLAVKPVLYPQVLSEIRGQLQAGAALLAIAPAFSIRKVCSLLGREEVAVVRAMPNTPALIGCGVTGVAFAGDTAPAVRTSVLSFLG